MPTDGRVDPSQLTMALAKGARMRGVKMCTETDVTGITLRQARVHKVLTDRRAVETEAVVNAAGQWADEIARMVGLGLPIIPIAHK